MNDRSHAHDRNLEDVAWVEACRGGDQRAFAQLVQRYQDGIFRVALNMLGEPALAEDAAQECFLRAFASLGSFDPARRFSTWLYRIAVNLCIDTRRKRREVAVAHAEPAPAPALSTPAEDRELRVAVRRALQRLPEDYRAPLVLKDVEEMAYEEIVAILGGTIGAMKIRVVRGRAKLASELRRLYPDLVSPV